MSGIGAMAAGYMMGRCAAPYYLNQIICIINLEIKYFFANLTGAFLASYFYWNFYFALHPPKTDQYFYFLYIQYNNG